MSAANGRRQRRGAEAWRAVLGRYARSGQDVAAFCAAEGVSVANFRRWRRRLGESASEPHRPAGFLDLGTLPDLDGCPRAGRLEFKLDLGGGLVLHLVRG
jgi:putative transposase